MKKLVLFIAGILCFSCNSSDDDKDKGHPIPHFTLMQIEVKSISGIDLLDIDNEGAFLLEDITIERKDEWHSDYVLDNQVEELANWSSPYYFYIEPYPVHTFYRITLPNGDVHVIEASMESDSSGYFLTYIKEVKLNSDVVFTADAAYYKEQGGGPPAITLIVE